MHCPGIGQTWARMGEVTPPYTITFVCTGNICRSPMGAVVLRDQLLAAGLGERVVVTSAGTGDWHVGERADNRTLSVLAAHGHDGRRHRARQFRPEDFAVADLVLALDSGHLRALRTLARNETDRAKVHLLRSFDADAAQRGELDVVDPYFGGASEFETTYAVVSAATLGVLSYLQQNLAPTG